MARDERSTFPAEMLHTMIAELRATLDRFEAPLPVWPPAKQAPLRKYARPLVLPTIIMCCARGHPLAPESKAPGH